jgi:hypothetical protein
VKAIINVSIGTIEVEGENPAQLAGEISGVMEVFNEECCGLCKSKRIRLASRTVAGVVRKGTFLYYEWRCQECFARLALGQQEGGRLFPKRKLNAAGQVPGKDDKDQGKPGKHNGWHQWVKQENPVDDDSDGFPVDEEPAQPAKTPPQTRPRR